jgi:prevent-host-death family protein
MTIINIHQAKTSLSKLIARVLKGEEVIIGKAGKPVAKITAFDLENKPRVPGVWKGKVSIAKDFDRLPARLLRSFGIHSA